jgi:hypothetical protein
MEGPYCHMKETWSGHFHPTADCVADLVKARNG